ASLIAANPSPGEGIGQSVIRREGIASGWPWLLWKGGLDGPTEIAIAVNTDLTRVCALTRIQEQPQTIHCLTKELLRPNENRPLPETGTHFTTDNSYGTYGSMVPLEGVPEV